MPSVPFATNEIADDKRETAASNSIVSDNFLTVNAKPEAIVRPLRRREPSDDDDNRSPDLKNLEAQIIDRLTKLEKTHKLQKQSSRDSDRKAQVLSQSRDLKKSFKEVSHGKNLNNYHKLFNIHY